AGVLQRGGASPGGGVAADHLLQQRAVLVDQPAGVVGGGRLVRVVRAGGGQPPGGVGQGGRPSGVASGQCAADQQDRALRNGDLAPQHAHPQGASLVIALHL